MEPMPAAFLVYAGHGIYLALLCWKYFMETADDNYND